MVGHQDKDLPYPRTQQTRHRTLAEKGQKCYIIDIKVGLDVNINKNIDQKHDTYFLLSVELKRLHKDYTFEVIPIILGATGAVNKHLKSNLEKIGIDNS